MPRSSASQAWKVLAEAQGSWAARAKQGVRERDRFWVPSMPCFGTSTLICIWSHWWAVQQGLWTSLCVRSRMEDGASGWMDDGWRGGAVGG